MIMPLAPADRPLTEEEFDRLEAFLDNAGGEAMSLEAVDGYFAALICGPLLVSMSEALPNVLGDQVVFDSKQQADEVLGLLMRHWNTISFELQPSVSGASGAAVRAPRCRGASTGARRREPTAACR
jgi:uncharacterized protein